MPTIQQVIDTVYPVGSIYRSKNEISPENIMGGKWIEIYPEKTYMCTFTVVALPNNETSVKIDTFAGIINRFKRKYGDDYSIDDRKLIGITISNGDSTANDVHVEGATWTNDILYAVFDRIVGTHLRLNVTYSHTGREFDVHNWRREE